MLRRFTNGTLETALRFPSSDDDPEFPLLVRAGARARRRIVEKGRLEPADLAGTLGASGGPKWLVLAAIDAVMLTELIAPAPRPLVHIGSSIGAWRAAVFAHPDAARLHRIFLDRYLAWRHEPGDDGAAIMRRSRAMLAELLPPAEMAALLEGPRRLVVVASRARNPDLSAERGGRLARGIARLMAENLIARGRIGRHVERVVFADPRLGPLAFAPVAPTRQVALDLGNLHDAILASSAIPFLVPPMRDPAGAPAGSYWDGGIIDYHFAEPVRPPDPPGDGILLYPHFCAALVPGWFDKPLRRRHRWAEELADVLFVAPHPAFVRTLPMGRIPSRKDFRRIPDNDERLALWRRTVDACRRLGEAFARLLEGDRLARLLERRRPC